MHTYMKRTSHLIILLLLCVKVSHLYSQNLDIDILKSINHIEAGQGFNDAMLIITNSTPYAEVGGVLVSGLVGWINDDDKLKELSSTTAMALVANLLFTNAIKSAVNRPRPMVTYPDIIINRGIVLNARSFPSGHTSSTFTFATSLSIAYPKWYVIVPAYAWASTVAFTRLYLGVHYPSDVLGGICVGVGSAFLSHEIKKWYQNGYRNKKIRPKNAAKVYMGIGGGVVY